MSFLRSWAVELVDLVALLDLLVLNELIKSGLPDGDHVLHNVPEDAFGESGGRQRALVRPPALVVDLLDELREVQLLLERSDAVFVVLGQIKQELVVPVVMSLEVLLGHHFEQEAQDGVAELRTTLLAGFEVWI